MGSEQSRAFTAPSLTVPRLMAILLRNTKNYGVLPLESYLRSYTVQGNGLSIALWLVHLGQSHTQYLTLDYRHRHFTCLTTVCLAVVSLLKLQRSAASSPKVPGNGSSYLTCFVGLETTVGSALFSLQNPWSTCGRPQMATSLVAHREILGRREPDLLHQDRGLSPSRQWKKPKHAAASITLLYERSRPFR
jgi:hypothetical protein